MMTCDVSPVAMFKCGLFAVVFKEIPSHNNPIEFYRIFTEYFQWELLCHFKMAKLVEYLKGDFKWKSDKNLC